MKKIRVFIRKRELDGKNPIGAKHDWIIECSNGDLPEEGYGHATKAEAKKAMLHYYNNPDWGYNHGWITPDQEQ